MNIKQASGNTRGVILAVIAYTIWGFSYVFTRIGLQSASPTILLAARFILAFVLMNILLFFRVAKLSLRGKKIGELLLLCLFQPIIGFLLESYGILYTNATFAGVMFAMSPIISIFIATIFLKERLNINQKIFIWLPVAGVIISTISGQINGSIRPIGVVLLLGCCITIAFSRIINRKISSEFTSFERTYFMMLIGSIAFTAMAIIQHSGRMELLIQPFREPGFLISVFALGVFCSFLAYFCSNAATSELSVTQISTISNLNTVVSVISGILILREPITVVSVVGAAMVIIGIWKVNQLPKPQKNGQISNAFLKLVSYIKIQSGRITIRKGLNTAEPDQNFTKNE